MERFIQLARNYRQVMQSNIFQRKNQLEDVSVKRTCERGKKEDEREYYLERIIDYWLIESYIPVVNFEEEKQKKRRQELEAKLAVSETNNDVVRKKKNEWMKRLIETMVIINHRFIRNFYAYNMLIFQSESKLSRRSKENNERKRGELKMQKEMEEKGIVSLWDQRPKINRSQL